MAESTEEEVKRQALYELKMQELVRILADCARSSSGWFPRYDPRTASRAALSQLQHYRVTGRDIPYLFDELSKLGVFKEFMRMAHPRRSTELRDWLAKMNVPWDRIAAEYEWELEDSLDIFFGIVAGVLESQYESIKGLVLLPGTIAEQLPKLAPKMAQVLNPQWWMIMQLAGLSSAVQKIIDKQYAEAPSAYFKAILGDFSPKLVASGLLEAAKIGANEWLAKFNTLMGQFEFFKLGQHIGFALGEILGVIEAGIGLAKFVPKIATAGAKLARELGPRLSQASKQGATGLRAIQNEISVLEALEHIPELKPGSRLPAGFRKVDLIEALKRGYMEMPDGRSALLQPCTR